ncbi:MAG: hypothetical protein IT317_08275 [Anaerolineales bacterium]|nr:hypothetical protein [Anaerolineales bacterium]
MLRLLQCLPVVALALSACAPDEVVVWPTQAPTYYSSGGGGSGGNLVTPMPTAADSVSIVPPAPTPTLEVLPGNEGLTATLADMAGAVGNDPTGAKAQAFATLGLFVDPHSTFGNAWWLSNDGRADIYEVLAVVLYTEGNTSFDVREAVMARYLWYCGGTGTTCAGAALINFLSYFQPWREPWVGRQFTNAKAAVYLDQARDLVQQRSGLLTTIIPGADSYVANTDALTLGGSINWGMVKFHFANVDPSWDSYLRDQLKRLPNGPARLWVLTINEAMRVCASQFICPDMTRARQS